MELDDQELLASLEAEEEVERVRPVGDSGYVTLCETSTQSSRGSSARMLIANVPSTWVVHNCWYLLRIDSLNVSTFWHTSTHSINHDPVQDFSCDRFLSLFSSRSETSAHSSRGGLTQSSRVGPVGPVGPVGSVGSVEGRHTNGPEDTDLYRLSSSDHVIQQEMTEHRVVVEDFPEEGFDDLPLDELDSVIFQENREFNSGPDSRIETNPNSSKTSAKPQTGQVEQHHSYSSAPSEPSRQSSHTPANDGSDFMDENMDCLEVDSFAVDTNRTGEPPQSPFHPQTSGERDGATSSLKPSSTSSHSVPLEQSRLSIAAESDGTSAKHPPGDDVTAPGVTLTSPPFTYLSLFEEVVSRPRPHVIRFCVKAFIVTLLGNLSGKSGLWRVCATISDGTGYLDVELSNEVLTSMLGFSVAEKGALKRNPARRSELDAGMKRCQEQLVDMCCVMTLAVEPGTRKAVVMKADPVSEEVYQQLEQRVRDRRKWDGEAEVKWAIMRTLPLTKDENWKWDKYISHQGGLKGFSVANKTRGIWSGGTLSSGPMFKINMSLFLFDYFSVLLFLVLFENKEMFYLKRVCLSSKPILDKTQMNWNHPNIKADESVLNLSLCFTLEEDNVWTGRPIIC